MAELEVPEGVQAFNFWTIWIMARLWEEFPRPQSFDASREIIYASNDARNAGTPINPKDFPPTQLLRPTIDWLLSEGFIRGQASGHGQYANVALTTKGFSVLNQVPRSVASKAIESKPLGVLMREALVDHAVGTVAGLIQSMLKPEGHG